MTEVVIIGGSKTLTASDSEGTENHLRYGAENDEVVLVQRTWRDLSDMFEDAAKLGRKYAIHQFVIAPYEAMSREFMLHNVLPLLAAEFKFEPLECVVVEHTKPRANDPNASAKHWHVVTTHFDPDDGMVGQRWWQNYQRQELVARIIEYRQWATSDHPDPAGPRFVRGRFHNVNVKVLCDHDDPEMRAIGAELVRVLPLGIEPEGTAPAPAVVRMHKRQGRDIVQLRKVCRDAWRNSKTDADFRQLMEAEGLHVVLAEEPPPRWMVTDGETVLGTLAV